MTGKTVGYIRVSSFEQNSERQLEGIQLDKVFIDKASGKDTERPQLKALLEFLREGDTLVVHSMDRLARNHNDLRRLVNQCNLEHITVKFIKEGLIFTGEDSPMANLLQSMMGAFAEFERTLIRERQMEGIALTQKRGAYKGRKKVLSPEKVIDLKNRVAENKKKSQIAREFEISRETLYKYLKGFCRNKNSQHGTISLIKQPRSFKWTSSSTAGLAKKYKNPLILCWFLVIFMKINFATATS